MNDYKVVNGIGRYWNEDSGKWFGNKIKYEIEEKYIRYEFSVYDDRQIQRDFDYKVVYRVSKFLFLIYKKCVEIKRRNEDKWVFEVDGEKYYWCVRREEYFDEDGGYLAKGLK